jgi:hypothetical protein
LRNLINTTYKVAKEQLTEAKINKHNGLLDKSKQSTDIKYYNDNFPKLLAE